MKIALSVGHGKLVRGASGYLDEVDEACKVVERVAEALRELDVGVETFFDQTSTTQNENLNTIVNWHNGQMRDRDVSVHFNAYTTTSNPMGTEVLYVTQSELAEKLAQEISDSGGLINRGGKYRSDLFFLNSTDKPAILIETCFVDSSADAELYREHIGAICEGIAGVLSDGSGDNEIERPPEPVEPPPHTEENRVDIVGLSHGDVMLTINGTTVSGRPRCSNVVALRIAAHGDVVVTLNGENFHDIADA